MNRFSKPNRYILLLLLLLFSLPMLGCGMVKQVGELAGQAKELQETVEALELPEGAPALPGTDDDKSDVEQPKADPDAAQPQPPNQSNDKPESDENPPAAANLDAVDSFRRHDVRHTKNEDGTDASVLVTDIEWTRHPLASSSVMSTETGEIQMELVTVGDTSWVKSMGGAWTKLDGEDISEPPLPELPNFDGMTLQGTETVSGVKCKHYSHAALGYEVWVADQKDIPVIVIRAKTKMGPIEQVVDITDVNKPITITAPKTE